MISVPSKCEDKHTEERFSVSEQRSEVIFLNPLKQAVRHITVDGCVFKDTDGKRCDHLVNVSEANLSVLVELKGSDMATAFEQLIITQGHLADHINRRKHWIICYSGSPRFDTNIQNLTLQARRESQAKLFVAESPYSYPLSTMHTGASEK